jgi:peptidyl-prolyl cis-trans isomerase D
MGVFQKIRNNSLLTLILVGGSLFLFVIGDALNSGTFTSNSSNDIIGSFDGEDITIQEFEKMNSEITYINRSAQQNKGEITDREKQNYAQQAWNQLLMMNIIKKEGSKIGIDVTEDELADMFTGDNPYPFFIYRLFGGPQFYQQLREKLTGNETDFAKILVENRVFNNYQEPEVLKNFGVELRKQDKLVTLIQKMYYPTNSEAKNLYNNNTLNTNVKLIKVPYYLISDSLIEVSDEEVTSYYKKNKEKFKLVRDGKKMQFAVFNIQPSQSDEAEVLNWAALTVELFEKETKDKMFVKQESESPFDEKYYKKNEGLDARLDSILFNQEKGYVYGPYLKFVGGKKTYNIAKITDKRTMADSLLVSHIQLTPDKFIEKLTAVNQNPSREEVLSMWKSYDAFVDSIYDVVSKNESLLGELAMKFSSDTTSGKDNGKIGWVKNSSNQYAKALIDSIFIPKTPVLQLKKVKVDLGNGYYYYHIVKVNQEGTKSSKIQVGIVSRTIVPGTETLDSYFAKANLVSIALSNGKPIDIYRDSLNYYVDSAFVEGNFYSINSIMDGRKIINWAFDKETKEKKAKIFDVKDMYVVGYLTENIEDYMPLNDQNVQMNIKRVLKDQKRFEYITSKLGKDYNNLFKNVESKMSGALIEEYTDVNAQGIPNYYNETALTGAILGLKDGAKSEWIKGKTAAYIVQVSNKKSDIANENTNFMVEKQQLKSIAFNIDSYIRELLEQKYNINDNRGVIR